LVEYLIVADKFSEDADNHLVKLLLVVIEPDIVLSVVLNEVPSDREDLLRVLEVKGLPRRISVKLWVVGGGGRTERE